MVARLGRQGPGPRALGRDRRRPLADARPSGGARAAARRAGVNAAFLLTSLVVVVTPGTGVLYTLAAALSRGYRASVVAAIGCTLGIVPQMAAAIFGLAAVLNASAVAFQSVKYLGVAYLLYLAWSTVRHGGALDLAGQSSGGSA